MAAARLEPFGVVVLEAPDELLPLPESSVDLVLDRHGRLPAAEVARVLAPGGALVTQQVGSEDCVDLNAVLGVPPPRRPGSWTMDVALECLVGVGLVVDRAVEEHLLMTFDDVGALVLHLRHVPWQLPGTSVVAHLEALRRLCEAGPLPVRTHRFLLVASRPAQRAPGPAPA